MNQYSAYNYFYDRKEKKIVKRAGELVREQRKEPLRYIYIGSYFAHQPQPYIEDGFICRKLYGKRVILMSTNDNPKQNKGEKMKKCPCEECKKQMKVGVDSLIDEGAPNMVIIDYINDMTTGQWTQCENCSDNNFTAKDETKGEKK